MQVPRGSFYTRMAWSTSNVIAAACGNQIDFLDPQTGSLQESIENAHDSTITSLEWAPALFPIGKLLSL